MDFCILNLLHSLGTQHDQLNNKKKMLCAQTRYKCDYHLQKNVIENHQQISPQIFQMVFSIIHIIF